MNDFSEVTGDKRNSGKKLSRSSGDRFAVKNPVARRGAHRAVARPKAFWRFFSAGLIAAIVLTCAGVLAVHQLVNTGNIDSLLAREKAQAEAKAATKVKPALDPEATVVLLDGTAAAGQLALDLDPVITQNKWGSIAAALPAAKSDVKTSVVFFKDRSKEPAALALAARLGRIDVQFTKAYQDYDSDLIVLLGRNYQGPAAAN